MVSYFARSLDLITWASQRETKLKIALRFFFFLLVFFYAGCPEGTYRVLKRVDFFLRGMPRGGIPCLKTGRFLFTRDALRGHTVSKNGTISFSSS